MQYLYKILESNMVPDSVIRFGIRNMLAQKIREESVGGVERQQTRLAAFIDEISNSAIAIETAAANVQHYEVPTEFYQLVLGKHLKYSCCLFSERTDARDPHLDNLLDQAEEEMLRLTCERAELGNGQDILELGCGWGSLSLFVATKYPDSRITAISNSATQKLYIDSEAKRLNLSNLKVVTCDVNFFKSDERYDRVVSVEMFEHMKNYKELLRRISGWLRPEGKLFVHIFCHRQFAYHYKNDDGNDWLTEHFFTGGTMPSADLFLNFQDDLRVSRQWHVNGRNYQLTAEAWLQKMDRNKRQVELIFQKTYGTANVQRWWVYWRLFFLACAELWGFRGGNEWFVAHYLFSQAQSSRTRTRDGALSVMIGSQQNNVIA